MLIPLPERWLGASYGNTLYWSFLVEDLYENREWANFLKRVMLFVNVWFFFIRKNCFIRCVYNLTDFGNRKWSMFRQ